MYFNANLGVSTLKDNNLNIYELIVLSIIWNCERGNKACFYKRDTLASQFNCSVSTIERTYKSLKDKGFIFISGKTKKLTQKGLNFCMGIMYTKMSSRQKKKVRHPKWLKEHLGKEQAQKDKESNKAFTVAKSKEERMQQYQELFGQNVKVKDIM